MNIPLRNISAVLFLLLAGLFVSASAAEVRAFALHNRLSIAISNGDVNLGEMNVKSIGLSTIPIIVKNDGETRFDLNLSLNDPTGWTAVSYSTGIPGVNQYRLFGIFASKGMPGQLDYAQDDIITLSARTADDANFASENTGKGTGNGVPPNKERDLYFRFDSCEILPSCEESLGITINITAVPTANKRCLKTIGKRGGSLSFSDGTSVDIPVGALSADWEISLVELDEDEAPQRKKSPAAGPGAGVPDVKNAEALVCAYALYPEGLALNKPAEACFLYSQSRIKRLGVDPKDLRAFCWDGHAWLLIPGSLDQENSIYKTQILRFSYYALFPAPNLTADDYLPTESIITPATRDGINDYAFFPNQSTDYEIFIYDITGRQVRRLNNISASGTMWDGSDERGNIVESGVYIYQFKADVGGIKKLISGTIAVAK
ncbi:MAG: gliding motility-associated C-terminal domain-containing protein [Elusimicrobiota bacterium]